MRVLEVLVPKRADGRVPLVAVQRQPGVPLVYSTAQMSHLAFQEHMAANHAQRRLVRGGADDARLFFGTDTLARLDEQWWRAVGTMLAERRDPAWAPVWKDICTAALAAQKALAQQGVMHGRTHREYAAACRAVARASKRSSPR